MAPPCGTGPWEGRSAPRRRAGPPAHGCSHRPRRGPPAAISRRVATATGDRGGAARRSRSRSTSGAVRCSARGPRQVRGGRDCGCVWVCGHGCVRAVREVNGELGLNPAPARPARRGASSVPSGGGEVSGGPAEARGGGQRLSFCGALQEGLLCIRCQLKDENRSGCEGFLSERVPRGRCWLLIGSGPRGAAGRSAPGLMSLVRILGCYVEDEGIQSRGA